MLPTVAGIVVTLLGTAVSAPLIDKKFTQMKEKKDKEKIKEAHYIQQLKIGLAEMDKKGTRINRMTAFFTNMITAKCNEHSINIDEDTSIVISDEKYRIPFDDLDFDGDGIPLEPIDSGYLHRHHRNDHPFDSGSGTLCCPFGGRQPAGN